MCSLYKMCDSAPQKQSIGVHSQDEGMPISLEAIRSYWSPIPICKQDKRPMTNWHMYTCDFMLFFHTSCETKSCIFRHMPCVWYPATWPMWPITVVSVCTHPLPRSKVDFLVNMIPFFPRIQKTRWWFQTFLIFTPIWGRFPIWLIFFRWVETTN